MFSKELPPEQVLEMEPEELAPFILRFLKKQNEGSINRYNFSLQSDPELHRILGSKHKDYTKCLMEAWMWLEREGFLSPMPGQQGDWSFVTRKGQRVIDSEDFQAYVKASLFPNEIDPILTRTVKPLFMRGDYDTAVFRAFKEVEVRIRKKSKLSDSEYGVDLMKKAFGIEGALDDKSLPKGERERIRDLFVGAIGVFKNPSSHREVSFTDTREVIDIISIANQLLRMLEK